MGEIALAILRWTVRFAFVVAAIFAFVVFMNATIGMMGVAANQNALNDIFALVQIWLPFNLNVMLLWITTTVVAYLLYRLTVMTISWMDRLIGQA